MLEQTDNTYHKQLQKIEKIANGINLDIFSNLTEVLRQRQIVAKEMIQSLKVNTHNIPDCVTYLNTMNEIINELLITKL